MSADSISNGAVFQNSLYIGINIQDILYGVELFLYFKTIYMLLTNKGARKKSHIFYVLFSSVMVFSITVWVTVQAVFGEKMWLLDPNYPGGPTAYWGRFSSIWYMSWGTTSIIILQLMTDGLMIYRCWVVWNSNRVVIIPIILWVATLVLGALIDWVTCLPGGDFFAGLAPKLGLAYYTVSMFLNTTLTCMICYHIVRHAKIVQASLGGEYASLYFTAVTIVVESVLPYTVSGIAFLVSLGMRSETSVGFISVYFMMMCISPQVLILRVIMGRALQKDTFKRPSSTLRFSFGAATRSRQSDSNAARVHPQTLPNV